MTLQEFFTRHPRLALGLSGGVDSAYLLAEAVRCGCRIQPYFVDSPFQPRFELEHARRLCEKQQILLARHMGVWPGACKHHTAHGMDGRRVLCRGTPQHAAFAAGRLCEPAEHVDHRCLPCSLRPQKPKRAPLWDMEGQIPHCLDFAICLCELYCCDCFQAAAPFLQSILNIRIKDKGREPRPFLMGASAPILNLPQFASAHADAAALPKSFPW